MITYKETFSLDVKWVEAFITCVCGKVFSFDKALMDRNTKNPRYKIDGLARCPHCNKLWHFEEREETFLLIRPRANAHIHCYKADVERFKGKNAFVMK